MKTIKNGSYLELASEDLNILSDFFGEEILKKLKLEPFNDMSDVNYFSISSLERTIERGIKSIDKEFVQH